MRGMANRVPGSCRSFTTKGLPSPCSPRSTLVQGRTWARRGAALPPSAYSSSSSSSSGNRVPRFDQPSVAGGSGGPRSSYGSTSGSGSWSDSEAAGGPGFGSDNFSGPRRSPPRQMSQEEVEQRIKEFQELLQETLNIVVSSGPTGFARGLQATRAVIELFQEQLRSGVVDPPQVILRKLFERLGATYVKLGQFIASSPSIFPDEYVLEFQKCLDKTDPVPFTSIKAIIEKELGKPYTEVFSSIDPQPLASASVAQVHAAVLKQSNKEVVIKVLRPGTEEVLSSDLNFVYLVTRFIEFIQPELGRLSLAGIVGDIRTSIQDEVDFRKEALHIQQFSAFLDSQNLRSVATCPYVYKPLSSQRILVMDRLRGAPLIDYDGIRSITSKDPEAVLVSALNTWFASVMGCETFHADVHAGNLMVLPDGRVAFIDFGIVGRVSPVTWKAVEALLAAVAVGDYDTMARALATIGACDADVDFDAFGRDLESFFTELEQLNTQLVITEVETVRGTGSGTTFAAAMDVDQTQVNRLFINLVRIGEKHSVKFPREFGLLVKQLLYFDRYTRLLAPSLQVLQDDRIKIRSMDSRAFR